MYGEVVKDANTSLALLMSGFVMIGKLNLLLLQLTYHTEDDVVRVDDYQERAERESEQA